MSLPTSQLIADRDRQFADWGEPVVFREVTQTYDPQTQQASEAHVETELLALVGRAPSQPTRGTAGRHLTEEISFLVKAEELPTTAPALTNRVVHGGIEYDVLKFTRSPQGLVYTLECRKRSP